MCIVTQEGAEPLEKQHLPDSPPTCWRFISFSLSHRHLLKVNIKVNITLDDSDLYFTRAKTFIFHHSFQTLLLCFTKHLLRRWKTQRPSIRPLPVRTLHEMNERGSNIMLISFHECRWPQSSCGTESINTAKHIRLHKQSEVYRCDRTSTNHHTHTHTLFNTLYANEAAPQQAPWETSQWRRRGSPTPLSVQ